MVGTFAPQAHLPIRSWCNTQCNFFVYSILILRIEVYSLIFFEIINTLVKKIKEESICNLWMVSKNMGTRYRVSIIKVELFETEVNCWDIGRVDDLADFVDREPDGRERGIPGGKVDAEKAGWRGEPMEPVRNPMLALVGWAFSWSRGME
jgi:hypothetical protein